MSPAVRRLGRDVRSALGGRVRRGTTLRLAVVATLATAGYGAAMGSFGVLYGQSAWQVLFSAVKSPLLIGATFTLTLPSFVVINSLLGLGRDLRDVLRALAAAQVAVALGLLSLAPLTLVWYLSEPAYDRALLFNAAVFAVATAAAQRPLRRLYRPLIARDRLHARMLVVWLTVYAFVGVQGGWVMRPFVGRPDAPAEFLRPDKWDNAYVIVFRLAWHAVSR